MSVDEVLAAPDLVFPSTLSPGSGIVGRIGATARFPTGAGCGRSGWAGCGRSALPVLLVSLIVQTFSTELISGFDAFMSNHATSRDTNRLRSVRNWFRTCRTSTLSSSAAG